MAYDFRTLSPLDFEDLTRDLIGALVGHHIEGFAPGPDGGVDGRYTTLGTTTVIQAKHLVESGYSALKSKLKVERTKLLGMGVDRYIVSTSVKLSKKRKEEIKSLLQPMLRDTEDILDAVALNDLLRAFPKVEKAHLKLWLSGSTQLECILRSAARSKMMVTREDILRKLKIFVPNEGIAEARHVLDEEHVLIISGSPGVGKTTLAEMLLHALIAEGFELSTIYGLEEGFENVRDGERQVFFFDDFLGKVKLSLEAVRHKDSQLTHFIKLVGRAPNARFILTTREYIFRQAREVSEYLSDDRLEILKYVLDVGVYTKPVRTRILYNHLLFSGVTWEYVDALTKKNYLKNIINHPNFNPRIVEWMTSELNMRMVGPSEYPEAFLRTLDRPDRLWEHAFNSHISARAQDLLIVLFFFDGDTSIDQLRWPYEDFHTRYSRDLGREVGAADFDHSLKELEGSFLHIADQRVTFCNPSVSDFMSSYVDGPMLLCALFLTNAPLNWLRQLWEHARNSHNFISQRSKGAMWGDELFVRLARLAVERPITTTIADPRFEGLTTVFPFEVSAISRIAWMMELWREFKADEFAAAALCLAKMDITAGARWHYIHDLGQLIIDVSSDQYESMPGVMDVKDRLIEVAVHHLSSGDVDADELSTFLEFVENNRSDVPEEILTALNEGIESEIENIEAVLDGITSLSSLDEYHANVEFLAGATGIDVVALQPQFEAKRNEIERELPDDVDLEDWWTDETPQTMTDVEVKSIFEDLTYLMRKG